MSDTTIDRARALLILRETVRCADAVSMCNQMGDVLQELLAEVERLNGIAKTLLNAVDKVSEVGLREARRALAAEARLRELASAEPVAWQSDRHWDFVARQRLDQSWHPLIRRPEMPS